MIFSILRRDKNTPPLVLCNKLDQKDEVDLSEKSGRSFNLTKSPQREPVNNLYSFSNDGDYHDLTPPLSRNSFTRSRSRTPINVINFHCKALTKTGTPCRLLSRPGRDFCYKHQIGDSIFE